MRSGPSEVRFSSPATPSTPRSTTSRASSSSSRAETKSRRRTSATASPDRGETVAAWPLLEESLRAFRRLGLPRGEAQALGYLAERALAEDDLPRALELTLESAAIAREIDWAWWESGQLQGAAALERRLGKLHAAEGHALRSLELSLALGDRRRAVSAAAELAVIAAERGDAERAGRSERCRSQVAVERVSCCIT